MIVWSLLLAVVWTALQGSFTPTNFLTGFLVSLATLWVVRRNSERRRPRWRLVATVRLCGFFMRELIVSNALVFMACLRPSRELARAVIAVPLRLEGAGSITILANMVTLTPGTLSLHVSDDLSTLYVHSLFGGMDDATGVRATVERFQNLVMEARE